jgi:riboflavin synthase
MFTGLIEEVGTVEARRPQDKGARIRVRSERLWKELEIGDSICVNGVCLTVVETRQDGFEADVSEESLNRTTLGDLGRGAQVNLERALTLSSPLGGHLVLGHVDGVGRIAGIERQGEGSMFEFTYPPQLDIYLVGKGSIAVDGISLTISSLEAGRFKVAVIPYTLQGTNLAGLKAGEAVNLETDIIAKYVRRFLEKGITAEGAAAQNEGPLYEKLVEGGFM